MNSVTRRRASIWFAAVLAAGAGAFATPARLHRANGSVNAQTPTPAAATQIDVLVINGSQGTGGIGAGLQNLPQLARPPFSSYGTLTLASRTTLALGATPATASIGGANSVQVTSSGRQPNGRYQVSVQLTLNGRTHAIQFAAAPGDPFFTAQTTGASSALILGFVVH